MVTVWSWKLKINAFQNKNIWKDSTSILGIFVAGIIAYMT